ncbi:4-hydroxy-tetrahydrodipicolinate synthase [Marinomonas mediterranea]|jgi:dihydrodipicolinate synthase|uniref:4-hydroxy-tetrahydrodipicolinate synthase n=1 Tax=Marinomonas mediterranea (strain ATCC 700492 / JCM 21426 / NBRC 103028 / MMB-1) TaxID=717774 RepID=F2K2A9_MARM1|nr:4-hydroxy-tetrahydrodipicolinate synthase [Marinomonas mediterranea]ADZ92289.1 Dihydrodipicolinate synthase [Marinomonas mediterranea MMB-1]WCN10240.1 4-hydroxy-tetrahydrodipicolinate synthase [Marinomonas mediterranea]WCN14288.1 4-hydroxy-tetrahydrodipicolinate synthase [Marinomonas mediterranea]WCN18340.1 4-hydroxy-tetrahydrodipicolinate synthase [Marinomonas mediterranea MMB-1]
MFQGAITALITPFSNNELDEAALRRIVRWQIDQGIDGLVPVGTTGESPVLTEHEHKRVIEITVEEANKAIPILAGAGSNNPAEAVIYARHAEKAGADATLQVAGYYNRPNQEGLYAHFEHVHNNSALPIVLYNIPPRTIVGLDVDTVAKLAQLERVIGIKDATGDLTRPIQERALISKPFSFLSGDDVTAVAYNVGGGNGCISVTANVAPKQTVELHNLCREGKFSEAAILQDKLFSLHKALFLEPNPTGAKYALSLLGLCSEECRLPMIPLSETTKRAIKEAMTSLELI